MLEMPPYRWPTVRSLGLRLLDRAKVFLRRAGTVILAVSHPAVGARLPAHAQRPAAADRRQRRRAASGTHRAGHRAARLQLEDRHRPDQFPCRPRGHRRHPRHDLRHGRHDRTQAGLQKALQHDLTPGGAIALLVFFAFAMQCMSTMAVVRRETGGWKWPALQFAYMTVLAYVSAFVAFRITGYFIH